MLTNDQLKRYSRNLKLRDFSEEDQERLLKSSVLLVGIGGLGSPISLYLTAMGVGCITIVEPDIAELSNLQRQIILDMDSLGKRKGEVAKKRLDKLNPDVRINVISEQFETVNARRLVAAHSITIDASDNFATKFLINDACILEGKPFSIGSVLEYHGQTSTFIPGKGPCYRCIFRELSNGTVPTTAEVGVLNTLPGIIGMVQATEAIKLILGKGEILSGRMLLIDALEMDFQIISFERNKDCPACGDHRSITLPKEGELA